MPDTSNTLHFNKSTSSSTNTTSRSPSPSQITIFPTSQNSQHRPSCTCNSWCVMASWWVMVIIIAWTMWHRHYNHHHDDNVGSPSPSLSLSPLELENMWPLVCKFKICGTDCTKAGFFLKLFNSLEPELSHVNRQWIETKSGLSLCW